MARIRVRPLLAFLLLGVLLAGCTATPPARAPLPPASTPAVAPAPASQPASAVARPEAPAPVPFVGKLTAEPNNGVPGTQVTVRGTELPANADLQLNWNTVKGSWVLKGERKEEFHGRDFAGVAVPLATVHTDGTGAFQARFAVPEDWGFDHDITVVDPATSTVKNRTNFSVQMQARMFPTSGPPGTPITVEITGMGYRNLENSWVLLYDNKVTGWISSVTTAGKATAVIPATGTPGKHMLMVNHGWASVAYLNVQQSPAPDRPTFNFEFTVTAGEPVLPKPLSAQGLRPEAGVAPAGTGPALWTNPSLAAVGTPVKLLGRGLPPGQTVEVTWARMEGNRISGQGWNESAVPLGKAVATADGMLSLDFKALDDLGGPHRLEARAGGQVVAGGEFTVTPSVVELTPGSGPAGTEFKVHLKGVGWTETANIYTLNYDNTYMGFACGFNTQGDVEIFLRAAGEPGWHFIDLYPAIYRGKDIAGVQNFRYPMLTGEQDHPGERLPIFRLAFHVTG